MRRRSHTWTPDPEVSPQPGEAPDAVVARAHGKGKRTVLRYRAAFGIPPHPKGGGRPKGSGWQPDGGAPAPGDAPDAAVAAADSERTGSRVSASTVQRWRTERGIPPFARKL